MSLEDNINKRLIDIKTVLTTLEPVGPVLEPSVVDRRYPLALQTPVPPRQVEAIVGVGFFTSSSVRESLYFR